MPPTHCTSFSPYSLGSSSSFALPFLRNAFTPTQRRTQVLTNHLQQICWSFCTQIKLMTSCVRSQRTESSSYHCSSLQYPAPEPDERSMIYQSVSLVLARGWFPNTKHAGWRRETPPPAQHGSHHTRAVSAEHMHIRPSPLLFDLCSMLYSVTLPWM